MSYATLTQIQMAAGGAERLKDLADWDGDGVIDAGVVEDAQARADAWIDSYLRLRFTTPVANPSLTLARLSADEVVYTLLASRRMVSELDAERRKERERELAELRDGKLRPDEPLPSKSTAVQAVFVENCGPVSRRGLKDIL